MAKTRSISFLACATRSLRVPLMVPASVAYSCADLASSALVEPTSAPMNDPTFSSPFIERAPSCSSEVTRRPRESYLARTSCPPDAADALVAMRPPLESVVMVSPAWMPADWDDLTAAASEATATRADSAAVRAANFSSASLVSYSARAA